MQTHGNLDLLTKLQFIQSNQNHVAALFLFLEVLFLVYTIFVAETDVSWQGEVTVVIIDIVDIV